MKLVNQKVEHVKFGLGKITEADDRNISVLFEGVDGQKTFQYPDAFGKYLKIMNPKLEDKVMKDYDSSMEQQKTERERVIQDRVDAKLKVKEEALKSNKKSKKSK